ncbi:PTS glucose transporter subunit IIA [Cellulomonas sp. APG4]|uniref:PTS sugar transporter subunit IIA n=1 Tax=Cellulomonas sp. APG4 TaxID=1538656 RepID=UPI00137AAB84|nr:PTS glucose transporter subunit IIA [Cellulomonas sp. APG4]
MSETRPEAAAPTTPLVVHAPVDGTVLALADVPDPVFAGAMVGPGLAIAPRVDGGAVAAVAPVAGTIAKLHPHAFVVAADGRAVLVHLGLDTVQLAGEGFELVVAEGDRVDVGDVVVRWDPAAVEAGGRSPVCPVVALDGPTEVAGRVAPGAAVTAGDPLFAWE